MFRINYSKLGLEEVKAAVLGGGGPESAGELCDCLVGKEISGSPFNCLFLCIKTMYNKH